MRAALVSLAVAALLAAGVVRAAPVFQDMGAVQTGTVNATVPWPVNHEIGDIALLFIESAAGEAANLGTPNGFVNVTGSPQDTGATRLTVYWARATSTSMASPIVTDPGNHVYAQILTFRDALEAGDPWNITGGGFDGSADVNADVGSITTTVVDTLVVQAVAIETDSLTPTFGTPANVNLTGIAMRSAGGTNLGTGGGIAMWDGVKATASATNTTTLTTSSSDHAYLSIALRPATTYYSRVVTGNWATGTTWSTAGCNGASAGATPVAGSNVVICSGHTITLNANSAAVRTLTIQPVAGPTAAGVLNIGNDGNARTLTVTGPVSNAGTLRYNSAAAHVASFGSTFVNSGTMTTAAVTGAKSLTVAKLLTNSGTFELAGNGIFTVNANGGLTNDSSLSFTTAQNHVLNVTGAFTNTGTVTAAAVTGTKTITVSGLTTNSGTFELAGSGVFTLNANGGLTNSSSLSFTTGQNHALNVTGALSNSGTFTSAAVGGARTATVSGLITNDGTIRFAGTAVMTLNANGGITNNTTLDVSTASNVTHALNVGGTFTNNGAVNFVPDSDSLVTTTFNGGAAQLLTGTAGSTTFYNLTLNNANGLTLSGTHNADVSNTLTLTSGRLTTGTNHVYVSNGSAVAGAGASTFVVGNLRKQFAGGANVVRIFEVGSITGGVLYAPVSLTLGNVTGAGDFTVSTTAGDHPNIASSTIDSTLNINRYWTLSVDSVTFTADAGNAATFTFNNAADYDAGANFANFQAARWDTSTWTEFNPTGRTATTVSIGGVGLTTATFAGDWQVGERLVTLVHYAMDESSWTGVGAVVDSSGNNDHATALGTVAPDDYLVTVPPGEALTGNPGTCGVGDVPITVGTQAIDVPLDPNADIGNVGTIAFWYSHNAAWNDGNDRMLFDATNDLPAGDKDFYLVKRGTGVNGGLRFDIEDSADLNSTANTLALTFAANTWHHVAVTWNLPSDRIRIYVDGVQQAQSLTNVNGTLGDTVSLYVGDNRVDGTITGTPGNYSTNSANGRLDEVKIYARELPVASIAYLATERHGCVEPGPHHFAIDHDGTAVNCQAEPVTITAHDLNHNVFTNYAGTIDLSTSTAHGDWTGPGGLSNLGNGAATYIFAGGDNGEVQLALKNTYVETLSINVADNLVTEDGTEDPNLSFAETGFIFLGDGSQDNIGTQISGKNSNVVPGVQTIELQAVRTSDDSGACEAALIGANDVDLRVAYVNPNSGTQDIIVNGASVGTGYSPVSMDFGDATDTTAALVLNYPDAGRIQLDARYDIPLEGGAPSGNLMLGSSNTFVVKPAGFCVESNDAGASCPAGNSSCDVFRAAGATFSHRVKAVGWQSAGEQNTDFCTGNTVTPNFRLNGIDLDPVLVAPAGGTNATLDVMSVDVIAADNGNHLVNNLQTVSEVGVFRITATPPAYLGETLTASTSANIGRFTPARLNITANTPAFAHACDSTGDDFTYLDQPFHYGTGPALTVTGLDATGGTTMNYGGEGAGGDDFWRMASTLSGRSYADPGHGGAFGAVNGTDATLGNAADYDGQGTLTLASGGGGDEFMYTRGADPEAPFNAEVDLTFSNATLTDSDGVCYDPDADGCEVSDTFSVADITGSGSGTAQQRFGRLVIGTAVGSELLPLAVRMEAEYFNGTGFILNADDTASCTGIAAASVDTSGAACAAGATTPSVAHNPLLAGRAGLSMSAPGEACIGDVGIAVDLSTATGVDLEWLRYDWDGDGAQDDDPAGRASFGVYGGSENLIYIREPWN